MRGEGRQFVDVAVVAKAVRLLTRLEDPHPSYVCVDRDRLTWERVARMVVARAGSSSEVRLLERDSREPLPSFRTERIEALLGGPSCAEDALRAQVHDLVRMGGT